MIPAQPQGSSRPVLLLGAGGHAKVLLSLLRAIGANVLGVCDPALAAASVTSWRGVDVLGGDEALDQFDVEQVGLVNGIGQVLGSSLRQDMFLKFTARGFHFPALVHPAAWVDASVQLGDGAQVMAGVIIQADTTIGVNAIINTGVRIDHDCIIGGHVHLAPSAVLCGAVNVASESFIGAGSITLPGVSVGKGGIVGAGTTLVKDLPAGQVVMSAPVRINESKYLSRQEKT
ncbi:acetyltransferase [Pseudomonas aegrilactucae]|uniref:Acetyltransferase n=1 Tax=Pseudomonas aegrilactucae TaxID=2854028 RepID=A0A9Q2XFN6_9PSED|nr:acetyltransferase [Pseudomonas aegrilactucae]MBV6285943.1 acetyltransferase [Pseudomonas aegrilactucae]